MGDICRRALVEGRVQGVWYRGSTQKQALKLGVTGWAKNLPDGRVEVLMCGSAEALDQLQAWLHKGPTMAKVARVEVVDEEWQSFSDFVTG
ncbi:acylphosphatase [Endozoicomonas sp. (ex Bugula neritina AB1)]|nr:acylphosphatase [Endozoicomonas sp. (ex Bugula neritina AB1)]